MSGTKSELGDTFSKEGSSGENSGELLFYLQYYRD